MSSIRQVAERAGVSLSTVSQVLNGNDGARIASGTKERVRRVADELGYTPNKFARSLITGKTGTIGLMISGLKNPFFVDLMESVEARLMKAGYQILLDAAPSGLGSYAGHGRLSGWPVDGVIMWANQNERLSEFLGANANVPVVYITGHPREADGSAVTADLASGAREAVMHLIERGYRSVADIVPFRKMASVQELEPRHRTYLQACREAGIELQTPEMEMQAETREAGFLMGQQIAAMPSHERPRALLCHNDVIAVGVYHGLQRKGVRVPEEVAVVGFDGIEEGRFLDKALTTVEIPVEAMCRNAVEMLLRHLDGDNGLQQVTLPTRLRVGETS